METPLSDLEKELPTVERVRTGLSWQRRLQSRFATDIDPAWADTILVSCFFVSGLVDGIIFNVYSCFVSMQTGNTIFAGLGVSDLPHDLPKYTWVKSLIAILAFCLGALFFSRWHRYLGPLKRWVLMSSFLLQTVLMVVTAALISTGVVPNTKAEAFIDEDGSINRGTFPWIELLPIALLAFQSAGQIVASRVLKYNAMPTVVLTSLYCDLMSDPDLFTAGLADDPDRNRRVTGAVALFVGSTVGGALSKSYVGLSGALWIATGVKGGIVLAWLVWPPKRR